MIAKQKISAIGKAINVPGKEIATMLAEVAGITKSSAASLDAYEMSIVMEYYTQKFDDGSSIEEYFAAHQEKVKAEEAKKSKKSEKKEEILPEMMNASGACKVLTDKAVYDAMSHASNPYGDGKASVRIADALEG